ncbi:hypothetical protein HDF16_003202 [Granulicella aggregans]|uniref:DUF3052 family protein n=1 Tax=Granulicella aggregans TaxID=474949 RepID=A0A7W8E3Z2_9BACT|nr:hypothetical protein [Granulicella aggregans]MBB5058488.1 hypothetical protein [Granulicella aggregans]
MKTVKLISFHPDVSGHAALLKQPGATVDSAPLVRTSAVVGEMANLNPAALVLDLDKLPSNSREIALMLRASKLARHIPILFAGKLSPDADGSLPDKFARLRSELPDIPYTTWPDAAKALGALLRSPATRPPIVPAQRTYTASLPQKLGILSVSDKSKPKPKQIALLAAPDEFPALLGDLPETVSFTTRIGANTHLAICFVRSLGDLPGLFDLLTYNLPEGASAWVVYPKGAPKQQRELNENDVRKIGLASGLVDYKICSIDGNWSAIKFARRKKG